MTKWQKKKGEWVPVSGSQDFTAVTARISRWKNEVHNRPEGTARRNFNTNREHFIEGEDFFTIGLTTDEIRTQFGAGKNAGKTMTLITESGYLMLVKSFDD